MDVISIIFIFEAAMKIISQGLYFHKNAYLKNGWNILDFGVVLTSIVEMIIPYIYSGDNLPSLKMLRILRVFRPLRTVK